MEQLAAYGSASRTSPTSLLTHRKRSRPAPLPPPPLGGAPTTLPRRCAPVSARRRQFCGARLPDGGRRRRSAGDRPRRRRPRRPPPRRVPRVALAHLVLRRPQIAPFGEALRKALRGCAAVRAECDALHQLPNDTSTRHFAAVGLRRGTAGHGAACRLVDAVDAVLVRSRAALRRARLHFSVAWSLDALPAEPSPPPPPPPLSAASRCAAPPSRARSAIRRRSTRSGEPG